MKKLLSILLALIFCLGMFVSCNNDKHDSSKDDESSLKYYQASSDFEYTGHDMPSKNNNNATDLSFGSYYKIIDTYDDFKDLISNGDYIDESFFEKNFIYVICHYSSASVLVEGETEIGYRNFYIDNEIAYLTLDKTFVSGKKGVAGNPASTINYTYITIPRDSLGEASADTIKKFKVNVNKIQIYKAYTSSSLENALDSRKNGDSWVLTSEETYDAFKEKVYSYEKAFNFEENIYLAVYREKSSFFDEIGYFDLLRQEGEVKLIAYQMPGRSILPESIEVCFDFVEIPRSSLKFSPDSITDLKLKLENILYFE